MDEFILSLFSTNDKLKNTTLFQVLIGKRTSSVLSFAFFNDLLPLLGALPQLKKQEFDQAIVRLTKEGKVTEKEGFLQLTAAKGHSFLLNDPDFGALNCFRFGRREEQCWRAVRFLVQAASFLGKDNHYTPMENTPEYTQRVRSFLQAYGRKLAELLEQELTAVFTSMTQSQADFLAQTLSGYHQTGKAFFQLVPVEYASSPWHSVYVSARLHDFLTAVCKDRPKILFSYLYPWLVQNGNQSMYQTRKLLLAGNTLAAVMKQRNLKKGTIQDHLIEWAIVDGHFPFAEFLSPDVGRTLEKMPPNSFQLPFKELTEQYGVSFLEIRLYQIWRKKSC